MLQTMIATGPTLAKPIAVGFVPEYPTLAYLRQTMPPTRGTRNVFLVGRAWCCRAHGIGELPSPNRGSRCAG